MDIKQVLYKTPFVSIKQSKFYSPLMLKMMYPSLYPFYFLNLADLKLNEPKESIINSDYFTIDNDIEKEVNQLLEEMITHVEEDTEWVKIDVFKFS